MSHHELLAPIVDRNRDRHRNAAGLFFGAVALTLSCIGCDRFAAVIPAQTARTVQIESYRQRYTVCKPAQAKKLLFEMFQQGRLEHAASLRWDAYQRDAAAGRFSIVGQVQFSLSLDATQPGLFFVEGRGRHILYNSVNKELLASATYSIVDDSPQPLKMLDQGWFVVRTRQQVVREFMLSIPRKAVELVVFVKVHVERLGPGVYAIDYGREHEVAIPVSGEPLKEGDWVRTIGYMQFDAPNDGRKLIDVRDGGKIREGYSQLLRQEAHEPAAAPFPVRWCRHAACEDGSETEPAECVLQPAGAH